MRVRIGTSHWRLSAQRAAFIEETRTLVVADAHFGKAASFRARGVPIPQGTTAENLARLARLIRAFSPARVLFLGDLFHARESHAAQTIAAIAQWRAAHAAIDMILVEGNHDLQAGPPPASFGLRVEAEPWLDGPFAFCHHPEAAPSGTVAVAGHLHPCVRLNTRSESLRLPCYWLREQMIVLPAFGEFTGGMSIAREPGDRVIAIAEERLFEIPAGREPE